MASRKKIEIIFNVIFITLVVVLFLIAFIKNNFFTCEIICSVLLPIMFIFEVIRNIYFSKSKLNKPSEKLIMTWRICVVMCFVWLVTCWAWGRFFLSLFFFYFIIYFGLNVLKRKRYAFSGLIAAKFGKIIRKWKKTF
jgi:hypothetical protein